MLGILETVGIPEILGFSDCSTLGFLDSEGSPVGQSDTDGLSDNWLLGFALTDGDSERTEDGSPDILGFSDGWDVGQFDIDGFSDGCG